MLRGGTAPVPPAKPLLANLDLQGAGTLSEARPSSTAVNWAEHGLKVEMQVGNAAFAGQEPNYSNDRHPLSLYSMAKRLTGGSFQEFLQLRRDRNAGKSEGSGHSVTNLLRGRGLSLARSGLTASDMPRRLASMRFTELKSYLLYRFSEDVYSSSFPCFLRKPEKML